MSRFVDILRHGLRTLLGALGSFALWTLWLALALLLVVQLYIVSASELAIPDFVLRQLEGRLAESGLRATFGRTSFDPTGRVLVYDARFSVAAFTEPIVKARAVYVQLNPLAMVVGNFEPTEVRIMDAALIIPGALSQSGQAEELVRKLDATIEPASRLLVLRQLSANVAGIPVTAQGSVPLQRRAGRADRVAIAEFLARRFPALCRQASALSARAADLESPSLELDLGLSESGALRLDVRALAREVKLPAPVAGVAAQVRASTRLLFLGDRPPSHFEVSAGEVRLDSGVQARGLNARVLGQFRPGSTAFDVREVAATADAVVAAGVMTHGVSALVFPRGWPRVEARIATRFLGEPLALRAQADLGEQSVTVRFDGALSPGVLDVISRRVGVDVRKYYEFEALTVDTAEARFGARWKFEKLTARVRIPRMNSYGVIMEDGRATVELDPQRFYSPDAFARIGPNFARGTYEHDLRTHAYRFLLDGRLRPLEIAPWFREWWPNFFKQLEFVEAPPVASVDVNGVWRDGRRSHVFVFADAGPSVIRGTSFERVRTRLFIRPAFFDALEILAARDGADAHGRFTLVADPVSHDWQTLDLALDSSLDLRVMAELLGPNGGKALTPFKLSAPPVLKLSGTFAGPAAPRGAKDTLRVEARTTGDFRFHDFPLHDAKFVVTLDGDDVVLDQAEARFAGGVASGHARVWGADAERRLGFDIALDDATLGALAAQLQEFFAAQKNVPPPPPGKYVQEKAGVRIDFGASAEGRYHDPLSFRGDGNVTLRGGEIGEVPLLGALSELFKFTALRFTEARSNFKIEGPKVVFPKVELRGANSAIDAHGEYFLDKRTLDFNAKVFPFQESESIIKSVVGAVLTPLSNALEVRLTGSLEKPEWVFVRGPTNFLRTLGEGASDAAGPKPPEAAESTATSPAAPKTPDPKPE